MTTIVVDKRERCMMADNQSTMYQNIAVPTQKIWRIGDGPNEGTLVGTSGASGPCLVFIEWFRTHAEHDFKECFDDNQFMQIDEEEDFICVLLTPDNKIQIVDRFFIPEDVPLTYYSVGSGSKIALGAMDFGATATEALDIACKRCVYTSKMGRAYQRMEL